MPKDGLGIAGAGLRDLAVVGVDTLDERQRRDFAAALVRAEDILASFAASDRLAGAGAAIYGDAAALAGVAAQWMDGRFAEVDSVRIVDSDVLNGAPAAFSADTGTIYLSRSAFAGEGAVDQLTTLLLHEYGHAVDAARGGDARGDEGALFSAFARGEALDTREMSRLRGRDDGGTITLDGRTLRVENTPGVEGGPVSISRSGGYEGSHEWLNVDTSADTFTVSFRYEMYSIKDRMILRYDGRAFFDTGMVSGGNTGTLTVRRGQSDRVEVIIATDNVGTAWNYDVSTSGGGGGGGDEEEVSTHPIVITGNFSDDDGDGIHSATGTVYLGYVGGEQRLLRIDNAQAYYNDRNFWITSGSTSFAVGDYNGVLTNSTYTLNYAAPTITLPTGTSIDFAGSTVKAETVTLAKEGALLGGALQLPYDLMGKSLELQLHDNDKLLVAAGGSRMGLSGTIRFDLNAGKFLNMLDVKKALLLVTYDASNRQLLMRGDLEVQAFGEGGVNFQADFSGDNYIRVRNGEVDFVGKITAGGGGGNSSNWSYKNVDFGGSNLLTYKGYGINSLEMTFDTIKDKIGGKVGVVFPFSKNYAFSAGAEFYYNPWELNKISLGVSFLETNAFGKKGIMIPGTGAPGVAAYLQEVDGSVNNWAKGPRDPDPTSFEGSLKVTMGPAIQVPMIDDPVAALTLEGKVKLTSSSLSGSLTTTIIHPSIARGTVEGTWDWVKNEFTASGSINLLDGAFVGAASIAKTSNDDLTIRGTGTISIPSIRWVPFSGVSLGTGDFLLKYTNDNDASNDFIAGWAQVGSRTVGAVYYFDGEWDTSMRFVPPVGSWDVEAGTEFLMVNVQWENAAAGGVPTRVRRPDGSYIQEADYAANGISVVSELTNAYGKTVVINNPSAGIWDVEVVDETGLGAVEYKASRESTDVSVAITGVQRLADGSYYISYNASGDAGTTVKVDLFSDDNGYGYDGTLIAKDLAGGSGVFRWRPETVRPGTYNIYAVAYSGDNSGAPAMVYADDRASFSGLGDVKVTKRAVTTTATAGGLYSYKVTVTNGGDTVAPGVILSESLPEGASLVGVVGGTFAADGSSVPAIALGDLVAGASREVTITVRLGQNLSGLEAVSAVRMGGYDGNLANNTARLPITQPDAGAPDLTIARQVLTEGYPRVGETFTYRITMTNNGTGLATNARVLESVNDLFLGAESSGSKIFWTGEAGAGNSYSNTAEIPFGSLRAGESRTVDVSFRPINSGDFTLSGVVSAEEGDTNNGDNKVDTTRTIFTQRPRTVDLSLSAVLDDDTVAPGIQNAIVLTITNQGDTIASGIEVSALLPRSLSYLSFHTVQGNYDPATGVWAVGSIAPGVTRTLNISFQPQWADGGSIVAEIISASEGDIDSTYGNGDPNEDDIARVSLGAQAPRPEVTGTDGADVMGWYYGNRSQNSAELLIGGAGIDQMFGYDGDDVFIGGADNDWIYGQGGTDVAVFSGYISDYTFTRNGNLVVSATSGTDGTDTLVGVETLVFRNAVVSADAIFGTVNAETLTGTAGADMLVGLGGGDVLIGGAGDDWLAPGTGSATVSGGDGFDTLDLASGMSTYVRVDIAAGTYTVGYTSGPSFSGIERFVGSTSSDTFYGSAGADYVWGGAGSDRFDDVSSGGGADFFRGGDGDDRMYGRDGDDVFVAGSGDDIGYGGAGADVLSGGSGDDTLYGEAGDDILRGDSGDDTLSGGAGSDTYNYSLGDGTLEIVEDYDTAGTDTLNFENIASTAVSVSLVRADTYTLHTSDGGAVTFRAAEARGQSVEKVTFSNGVTWTYSDLLVESRTGTNYDDWIVGTSAAEGLSAGDGNDTLDGNGGNDILNGGAGNDVVRGGAGDDILFGRAGDDTLIGGLGSDRYVWDLGNGSDFIDDYDYSAGTDSSEHVDQITFGAGITESMVTLRRDSYDLRVIIGTGATAATLTVDDHFSGRSVGYGAIERILFYSGVAWDARKIADKVTGDGTTTGNDIIFGSAAGEVIVGDEGHDTLYGDAGDDTLLGGAGDDDLYGEIGADTLNAGAGDDALYGGDGDDRLLGGEGNDRLYGEAGSDILQGGGGSDTLAGGAGADTYIFGVGDHAVRIADSSADVNRVVFGSAYGPGSVQTVWRNRYDDLVIDLALGKSILIEDWFRSQSISSMVFGDGTTWTGADILSRVTTSDNDDGWAGGAGDESIDGLAGDDSLSGGNGNDMISGGAGNDTLDGGAGNDKIMGGAGNDVILADDGADTIIGGAGDDTLNNGAGVDTFVFRDDFGADQLYTRSSTVDGQIDDEIDMRGLAASDLTFMRSGYSGQDLVILQTGTMNKVTVANYAQADWRLNLSDGAFTLASVAASARLGNTTPYFTVQNYTQVNPTSGSIRVTSLASISDGDGDPIAGYRLSGLGDGAVIWLDGDYYMPGASEVILTAEQAATARVLHQQPGENVYITLRISDGFMWTNSRGTYLQRAVPADIDANGAVDLGTLTSEEVRRGDWLATSGDYSDTYTFTVAKESMIRIAFDEGAVDMKADVLNASGARVETVVVPAAGGSGTVILDAGTYTLKIDENSYSYSSHRYDFSLVARPTDEAPVVSVDGVVRAPQGTWQRLRDIGNFEVVDDGGATPNAMLIWDQTTGAGSSYFWISGEGRVAANEIRSIKGSDLDKVWLVSGTQAGTDTLGVRAHDGAQWGEWTTFTMESRLPNHVATVTARDMVAQTAMDTALRDHVSVSDADGDDVVLYRVYQATEESGSGTLRTDLGAPLAARTTHTLLPGLFNALSFRGGEAGTSDRLLVKAFDGTDWSDWSTITVSNRGGNSLPEVEATPMLLAPLAWSQLGARVTMRDADGDGPELYRLYIADSSSGNGRLWNPGSGELAARQNHTFTPDALRALRVQGGDSEGDSLSVLVRAYDGREWGDWSSFDIKTRSTNVAPDVTTYNRSRRVGEFLKASSLLSATDADGDAVVGYMFWDNTATAGSGAFRIDGKDQAAGSPFAVAADRLKDLYWKAGESAGTDAIYVRAWDGFEWSGWRSASVTTLAA